MFLDRPVKIGLVVVGLLLGLLAVVVARNLRDETPQRGHAASLAITPQLVERGAYLARAGNCATCHTTRGGAEYAGGRGIETPFGIVFAGNLTPDAETGIGRWSAADFWRAMHNGRSKDGRLLVPAFPYPSYTQVSREDADALHAYLRTLPPVRQANRPHELRFPYGTQAALAVWRAMFFEPGSYQPQPQQSAEWNRGAYLVKGLGHCVACHSPRNAFGAITDALEFRGGLIPMQNWYAPSLASPQEAGVADWPTQEVAALLKTGVSPRASVIGPMADVVFRSTQYLTDADLQAMAVFLKGLPQHQGPQRRADAPIDPAALRHGAKLYDKHCASCHGDQGEGARGAYPALAGNRMVTLNDPTNLVRMVVGGGFPPTTAGNPAPYGMPPFGPTLANEDIAAVLSHIRNAWGHHAPAVSALEVMRARY
ncbi:c-type cytochrome [Ideonella sp.]|uniref:c-type cytochrome n=1 Tax=Ideonella sp. TaxID=1929293 RepID=UPI0039C869D2